MTRMDAVEEFAHRLVVLLRGVLDVDDMDDVVQVNDSPELGLSVISSFDRGIPLRVEGKEVLRLAFEYECEMSDHGYLTIDKSSIRVLPVPSHHYVGAPFFHYDYVRDHHGHIPAAHMNIHASNDELTKIILQCGSKERGKRRRKDFVKNGTFPTVSDLHFPLGGNLFRPSLEDVLEMLIAEFGIDAHTQWHDVITKSRYEYRMIQYKALVREHPEIAVEALRESGLQYDEATVPAARRGAVNRLTAY